MEGGGGGVWVASLGGNKRMKCEVRLACPWGDQATHEIGRREGRRQERQDGDLALVG